MKAHESDKRSDEGEDLSKCLDITKARRPGIGQFGLKPEALELIRSVFCRHPGVREVRIFGSRATGHFENESDVDLALWGDLDHRVIARIFAELDELPLPYTFDVKAYDSIRHEQLRCHIDEVGQVLYRSEARAAST